MKSGFSGENHLALIDGYSFLFRAYHSLPSLTNSKGLVIGAVYGYSNMIIRLRKTLNVSHLAVIFDHGLKTFRNDIYDQYKANRPPAPEDLIPQFPLVRDVTNAMNIVSIEKEGYEADDLIATMAKSATENGLNVTVISSDKDLTQLIDDRVRMYDPMKQKIIDKDVVYEKYGVYPNRILDLLSLMGDSADNIPGVPGIGPKIAAELLNNYDSLEGVFENAEQIKQPKRKQALLDNHDKALLSKELVALKYDVDIDYKFDDLLLAEPNLTELKPFFEQYEFSSLLRKIDDDQANNGNIKIQKDYIVTAITKPSELSSILERISKSSIIIIEVLKDKLYLSTEDEIVQGDIIEQESTLLSHVADGVSIEDVRNFILSLINDKTIIKIFPDFKRFYRDILSNKTVLDFSKQTIFNDFKNVIDIEVLNYLLPKQDRLKIIPYDKISEQQELVNVVNDVFNHYHNARKKIVINQQFWLCTEMDLPLNMLLLDMENNGSKLDQSQLLKLTEVFSQEAIKLEGKIYQLAGEEFNIGSPKQLGEILFDKLSIESSKKNKKTKSLSTSVEVLEELSIQGYEIAGYILKWRHFTKLKNTYTEALPKLINNRTGRVHSHFSNTNTSTGRLSSNNPNLQNIPVRSSDGDMIREAFICEPGNLLISADYSQIELRLLAHYAKVEKLQQAFHHNKDIHAITASEVFGVDLDQVDSDLRRKAKTINFGIIYGISGFGLAKRLGISRTEAKDYIDLYFTRYPEIKSYMTRIVSDCTQDGYVETVMTRKLFFPELKNTNSSTKGFIERAVINAPLQGSAADIIKKAMLDINKIIISKNLSMRLLLQVHDELIYEVPEEFADEAMLIIKNGMENAVKLDVPLEVSVNAGKNWREIH